MEEDILPLQVVGEVTRHVHTITYTLMEDRTVSCSPESDTVPFDVLLGRSSYVLTAGFCVL